MKDAAGNPVPNLPLPPVWVQSGSRAALQIPEGKLADGASYRWSVRACDSVGCSPWSAEQMLTVRLQPLPSMPATQSLALTGAALAGTSAPTDCDTPGCATVPNGQLRIGTADGHLWATHLKANLSALPPGARVTSAKLSLTRADCTTQCVAQKPSAYELSTAWTAAQSGKDLLTAAGDDSYVSDLALSEVDFGMLVQSWLDRGGNEGLALTVPGTVAGASYHSGAAADPALRPKLTVEYLPPTAPGAVSDVVTTPGDTGLLATWNAPLDSGTTGDVTYVAKAEKSDGTVTGTWEGTALRAVFGGLDNALSYRVSVTAKNAVGSGPVSRSALAQGASVAGGTTPYKDYVQAYLSARNKVMTGVSATTAEAAAESPHGAVFGAVLDVQEASLIGELVALGTQGQAYVGASSALTDTMVADGGAARVLVRATVIQTTTLRVNGVDEVSEDRRAKRFVFNASGGTVKLESESDDSEAGQKLSPTAAAGTQVAATPADTTGVPTDGAETILLGDDGFPVSDPVAAGALTASYVNGSGTASWAWNNAGRIPRDYGSNDCTNFVSKALYNGGGMKMRHWAYWQDRAWWRNTSWTSWKKNSHTWSGAQNLFTHMLNYRQPGYVNRVYNLRPGDILFFSWKKDNGVFNHAAVVTGNNQGVVSVAQHGYSAHDTLQGIMARHRTGPNPIVEVGALRPTSR
ncbi:amidase domain-containing protein [Streptomyces sp. NPDC005533]|uniref:amidase domain-containing protein n=1 Tax=Streptomyces sp. NPDC005533 TaxID=3364723 RepID=UPI0036931B7B